MGIVEWIEKGIAALRSGHYKQTTGGFYRGGCFCALGVVLFQHPANRIYKEGLVVYRNLHIRRDKYVNSIGPMIIEANDRGKSFLEIAEWLENEVLPILKERYDSN